MGQFCEIPFGSSNFWWRRGLSPCLYDLLQWCWMGFALMPFLLINLFAYQSFEPHALSSRRRGLMLLQTLLHTVVALLPAFQLLIRHFITDPLVYDHEVVNFWFHLIIWFTAVVCTRCEFNKLFPLHHCPALLFVWSSHLAFLCLALVSFKSDLWWWRLNSKDDLIKFSIFIVDLVATVSIVFIGYLTSYLSKFNLLHDQRVSDQPANARVRLSLQRFWLKASFLFPYVWPKGKIWLQLCLLTALVLLVTGRVVNLFTPIYHKKIVDSLNIDQPVYQPKLVLIYVFLILCQGGAVSGGLLNNIRSTLWIKVQQYSSKKISAGLFQHIHNLSLRWHLNRKTGEVLRIMDRGVDSVNQMLNYMVFNIVPTILDIIIAVSYFSLSFNYIFGIIVFITMLAYLFFTIMLTEWRTKFRMEMNVRENELKALAVDSLLNYETVKYCNAETSEIVRYLDATDNYQKAEFKTTLSLSVLNLVQNFTISAGLLSGTLLCTYFVATRQHGFTIGDYVLFAAYIMQLYQPLNWLGTYYRLIQQAFVDMDNMFELFAQPPDVQDLPGALPLMVDRGKLEFRNVFFSYGPDREILKSCSFTVNPGETVAVVGPSGSGKTTLMRLLLRFYNCTSGAIYIDDQNIALVTQDSLRRQIAVVPQETTLFNHTIKFNISIGRENASEEEMVQAAKIAEIHGTVLTFPEGYDSQVGERGLKMSGGEKQRVAIARAVLKRPSIIILDEATSSLDSQTEHMIQESLIKACEGKTTLVVAHRLSTVVHANQILVLNNGILVESGTHQSLLASRGLYAAMWYQQSQEQSASSDEQRKR